MLNNILLSNIPNTIAPQKALQFTTTESLSDSERNAIIDAYMKGIHVIMCLGCPLISCCLLSSFFIKDVALEGRKEGPAEDVEAGNVNRVDAHAVDIEKTS